MKSTVKVVGKIIGRRLVWTEPAESFAVLSRSLDGHTPPVCGDHGVHEPTCDYCNKGQCSTPEMEWNGDTGNHFSCEGRIRVDLCADCIYFDANGWDDNTGRPLPDPKPMNRLDGYLIGTVQHTFTGDDDHDCEGHFSWQSCDGCGQTLGGDRYCYVAVKR